MKQESVNKTSTCGLGRMSTKNMVEDKIRMLRKRADNLETLLGVLPELTSEQDNAVWSVFTQLNR